MPDNVETLWAEYRSAFDAAEKSKRIEDGIAAGKAWAAFLRSFEDKPAAPAEAARS